MTTEYRHMLAQVDLRIKVREVLVDEWKARDTLAGSITALFHVEMLNELRSLRSWLMERESEATMQADDELDSDRIRQEQAGLR